MIHWDSLHLIVLRMECWVQDNAKLRWTTESVNNYGGEFYPNQT